VEADRVIRILIIEDNPAFLKIMKMRLQAAGYEVLVAEDGLSGLNMAREEMPDLIISDLMLPNLSGHQVSRMLKFDEKYKHIPIVMLTSRDLEEAADRASECRADAFIIKTTKAEIVMDIIKRMLEKKGILSAN